jgi:hypothetical protein
MLASEIIRRIEDFIDEYGDINLKIASDMDMDFDNFEIIECENGVDNYFFINGCCGDSNA